MPVQPPPSARSPTPSSARSKPEAEVLTWIGTAYARRSDVKPVRQDGAPQAVPFFSRLKAQEEAAGLFKEVLRDKRKRSVAAGIIALSLVALFAIATLENRTVGPVATGATEAKQVVVNASNQTVAPNDRLPGTADAPEESRTTSQNQDNSVTATRLDIDAHHAAEEKVAELEREVAELKLARENSEQSLTAQSAQLEAERRAREVADQQVAAANERLAHQSAAEAAPVAAQSAAPTDSQPVQKADQTGQGGSNEATPSQPGVAMTDPNKGKVELAAGQKLLAGGDLDGARQHFVVAANLGLAEGALALGNTFDPVSLAKLGLKKTGDPPRARQWYRRAYVMALRPK
jgi:hypothetical protein